MPVLKNNQSVNYASQVFLPTASSQGSMLPELYLGQNALATHGIRVDLFEDPLLDDFITGYASTPPPVINPTFWNGYTDLLIPWKQYFLQRRVYLNFDEISFVGTSFVYNGLEYEVHKRVGALGLEYGAIADDDDENSTLTELYGIRTTNPIGLDEERIEKARGYVIPIRLRVTVDGLNLKGKYFCEDGDTEVLVIEEAFSLSGIVAPSVPFLDLYTFLKTPLVGSLGSVLCFWDKIAVAEISNDIPSLPYYRIEYLESLTGALVTQLDVTYGRYLNASQAHFLEVDKLTYNSTSEKYEVDGTQVAENLVNAGWFGDYPDGKLKVGNYEWEIDWDDMSVSEGEVSGSITLDFVGDDPNDQYPSTIGGEFKTTGTADPLVSNDPAPSGWSNGTPPFFRLTVNTAFESEITRPTSTDLADYSIGRWEGVADGKNVKIWTHLQPSVDLLLGERTPIGTISWVSEEYPNEDDIPTDADFDLTITPVGLWGMLEVYAVLVRSGLDIYAFSSDNFDENELPLFSGRYDIDPPSDRARYDFWQDNASVTLASNLFQDDDPSQQDYTNIKLFDQGSFTVAHIPLP